jgi:hypothetical protein
MAAMASLPQGNGFLAVFDTSCVSLYEILTWKNLQEATEGSYEHGQSIGNNVTNIGVVHRTL